MDKHEVATADAHASATPAKDAPAKDASGTKEAPAKDASAKDAHAHAPHANGAASGTAKESKDSKKPSFTDLVRKFALAGVGAVVVAQEEVEDFVGKLVQKGELAEKDGKTLVKDLMENRAKVQKNGHAALAAAPAAAASAAQATVSGAANAVTAAIDSTVDKVLHRINIPTKSDVEELSKKIEELSKKVEALAAVKRV